MIFYKRGISFRKRNPFHSDYGVGGRLVITLEKTFPIAGPINERMTITQIGIRKHTAINPMITEMAIVIIRLLLV
jgi:hypothetical protein